MSQVFQDDFNYGTASSVTAFSNVQSEHSLDSNYCKTHGTYRESSVERFRDGTVASNAFISSPAISPQDSIDSIPQSAIGVNAFGSSPLGSYQSQMDYDDSSFPVDYSEEEFAPIDPSLDSIDCSIDHSLSEQISFDEEACQSVVPYSKEEFEIEIEDSSTESAQSISEKKQGGFKRIVEQAVEGGIATTATSILSAYINPVAATAVVNTGMAAEKKVCFGITNRRAQKKTTESSYSPTAVADSVNSDSVPEQFCTPSLEKFSEGKATKWKEKGKEIGVEVGKEVVKQICFGIEKRRKQKTKGSSSVGKISKHSNSLVDSSLDYELGGSEFGVKDFLSEIDVAEVVSAVSSCLHKKSPVR